MPYTAPVAEQRFALEQSAGLSGLAATERFAAASPDVAPFMESQRSSDSSWM